MSDSGNETYSEELDDQAGSNTGSIAYSDEEENHIQGYHNNEADNDIENDGNAAGGAVVGQNQGQVGAENKQASNSGLERCIGCGNGCKNLDSKVPNNYNNKIHSCNHAPIWSLTAPDFYRQLHLLSGPEVKVFVGPEKAEFSVPKTLLCASSHFFEAAFNGNFKEGIEQEIHLEEDSVLAFQMLIQFLYIGNVNLTQQNWCDDQVASVRVGHYLEFFKLADKIGLRIPQCRLVDELQKLLNEHKGRLMIYNNRGADNSLGSSSNPYPSKTKDEPDNVLTKEHIKTAFELTAGHPVQTLMGQACVVSYLRYPRSVGRTHTCMFKFDDELRDVDGFAAEILRAVKHVVDLGDTASIKDPISGFYVRIQQSSSFADRAGW